MQFSWHRAILSSPTIHFINAFDSVDMQKQNGNSAKCWQCSYIATFKEKTQRKNQKHNKNEKLFDPQFTTFVT